MQPTIDIKFLSNEDFNDMPMVDRLGEDVSESWGVYNPYTGKIRIRNTGFWDVNQYLLEHELEHAIEEHATDVGPNGLRHKKKGGFAKIFSFVAPLLGGIFGGGGQKQQAPPPAPEPPPQNYAYSGIGLGTPTTAQTFGSAQTPFSGQESTKSTGLNQGLSQQSINPLADPYSRYGQLAGRVLNF